ncbi:MULTISPECIES: hypothetical protein [unclassified Spirosoma]|uniref:hypothetical protein n=1 Tax=unclassified Spirosoma TaxID=2621999 RepID=UPI000969A739|nr:MULTISPECIES: hypothetical protein [unclassified Spirosoma]MBN8823875.1 hypothetical protein [Spirosoma sp.]OJW79734.1 MAG: hypothetical protein BGO59_00325 [Spirosoma sp. 48-14]
MISQDNITLSQRLTAPTPKFFKTLRTIGLTLAAVGGAVIAAPVAPIIATIGGYLLTAGTVASAVSSLPVDYGKLNQ